jgi:hypothetical protein
MCSRAFLTVMPCGSTTAFLGVMMILAFMREREDAREKFGCMMTKFFQRSEQFLRTLKIIHAGHC